MKRLKELRQERRYSQRQLAEMLQTTQQTIARWETGAVEPSLSKLRDIALIFGVAVDDLLGGNPLSVRPQSTTHHIFAGETSDGFWGHAGLLLDGNDKTIWFPITSRTATAIRRLLNTDVDWLLFPTLDNHFVAARPNTVRKFWLVDDDCDAPEDDWNPPESYSGLPLEMYRAFEAFSDTLYDREEIEAAARLIPEHDEEGALLKGAPEEWSIWAERAISEIFDGEASETFIATVVEHIIALDLHHHERISEFLHYSKIFYVGGGCDAFWVEPSKLSGLLEDIESFEVPRIVDLEKIGGTAEIYVPSERISAIIMPMLDVLDHAKSEQEPE